MSHERPRDPDALLQLLSRCGAENTPIYPRGGGISLDYGGPPERDGVVVETTALNRVVDYPSGDMTITVEAGMTHTDLQATLAQFGQRLPLDAPRPDRATLGGIFATNHSGPRRFGSGRPRDMIIGVAFATSEGALIRGGGRVVKNVAGYDFPRLITGSLGTLGVITELTLKVRPKPEASAFVWSAHDRLSEVADELDRVNLSGTRPVAVELLDRRALRRIQAMGVPAPDAAWAIAVGYESNRAAVAWQLDVARTELRGKFEVVDDADTVNLWTALSELTDAPGSPVAVRANVRPSSVPHVAGLLADAGWTVQSHAASGIVRAFDPPSAERMVRDVQAARAAAVAGGGNLISARCAPADIERLGLWGEPRADWPLMRKVRAALDPRGLMNPGRLFATIPA